MDYNEPVSLQVRLVREMQAAAGQAACFATPAIINCPDKECCWRHDCFDESLDSRLREEKA